ITVEKLISSQNLNFLINNNYAITKTSSIYKQQLTHQTINGLFINISVKAPLPLKGYQLISKQMLKQLPFPKFITTYLKDKNVSLNLYGY
ncbi:MAG: hypothetical protein M3004_11200, partial [Bacteroidota bacterium]|nr:hypothetical protein [Bacteroidota bacterium]